MKKIIFAALWFLSFSLTAAAYNTYAPNSWDTVKKEAWDYQAVYDLCEKGCAPGYDVNFFNRGSLTRYELASVLKDILEAEKKGSTLTDEERKKLARLKKEYIRELDALGYSDEKKEPIIEISGDARVRWTKGEENDARIRTGAKWNIGNSTYIQGQGSINS
jgi:hypothetical protein